jgi:hypothetical protein
MAPRINATVLAILTIAACHKASKELPARAVPHVTGAIKIDGEWDEPDWSKTSLRGQFLGSDGQLSRPTSEVRFLRDDTTLYVGCYAADDDIRSTDAFDLKLGTLALHIDATGNSAPLLAGMKVAVDRDGTLDDPRNFDEEWLLEIAIPIASLPDHGPANVTASRCDTPKHGKQLCSAWSGRLVLP